MKAVCQRFGFSYDWRREISTCEPEYYRWNQWFFLRMLERGLAYRKRSLVNWCPKCQTVLANEQVVDGCCWQHDDTPVEAKEIEQWFLRITQYADALLDDMAELEGGWPERVLVMQRNWIGKSRGTRVRFAIDGRRDAPLEVFTTRVDTIYGVCGRDSFARAPAAAAACLRARPAQTKLRRGVERGCAQRIVRGAELATAEKEGFFTGRFAVNPFSGEQVPIWVGEFRAGGIRHRRGDGRAGARSARFRVRAKLPAFRFALVVQPLEGPALRRGSR